MSIHKTSVASAVAAVLGATTCTAQAALTTGSVLEFNPGAITPDNTVISGSYFSLDTVVQIPISMFDGIILGVAQPASGSHGGPPNGSETPAIDTPWNFKSNTGMHYTTSPIVVIDDDVNGDGGFTKTLDFSGWAITWNTVKISLGGGFQDCGTSSDGICVTTGLDDLTGTYDNGSGLATITCSTASCSTSSTFTLNYAAVIPQADPSNFGGVSYNLFMEGHVGAVPVPAAAWLFGSGLAGLAGVARRKDRNRK